MSTIGAKVHVVPALYASRAATSQQRRAISGSHEQDWAIGVGMVVL